jgi:hypothetical protein
VFIVPIKIYGLTEFAAEIGGTMDRKKMSVLYSRGKLPEPFAIAGDRPFWIIDQIEWYKGEQRNLTVPELKKVGLLPKECQVCLDSANDDWHCPRSKRIEDCPRKAEFEGG